MCVMRTTWIQNADRHRLTAHKGERDPSFIHQQCT